MGTSDSLAWSSLALSVLVALIAAVLGLGLWRDRRSRIPAPPASDRKHFFFQDLRRGLGVILLAILSPAIYVGSRLPTFMIDPASPQPPGPDATTAGALVATAVRLHPNHRFLAVWMAVFGSVVALLVLALIDWISTRLYARRQRNAMDRERLALFREAARYSRSSEDGLGNGRSV